MKRDSIRQQSDDRISELFDDCVKILNSAKNERQRYSAMMMVKRTIDIAVSEKARYSESITSEGFLINTLQAPGVADNEIKKRRRVASEDAD